MTSHHRHPGGSRQQLLALLCAFLIGPADAFAYAALTGTAAPQAPVPAQTADTATLVSASQLDSLVAPIALYPDPLLAQVLAASTYPLELMQLQQWLTRNPGLKDKALADAVAQQPWDPSVQAMAGLPDVVKLLTENVQWTTDLGNAFLAQQGDVMNAVQRMRQSAQAKGALQSTAQQVVQTEAVDGKQVIVIEQANPQVIYVPQYTPAAIWGTPVYPWPTMSYPWGWGAGAAALSFGAGIAMGSFWGGGWGWNTGWGGGNLTVNNFNNFNRAAINRNGNFNRNGNWQHNAAHRGGTLYRDRATANRFGGTTRGDSLANRQSGARQQLNRQGGQLGTSGLGNRGTGNLGNRGAGNLGNRGTSGQGIGNRPGGGFGDRGGSGLGNRGTSGIGGGNLGNRPGAGSGFNRPTQLPSGIGDRAGSRDFSRSPGSGAFGGGSRGFDGAGARRDFNRGSSSFGSRGSGGFNRGGGGFSRGGGGFSRGGGGFRGGGGGGRRGGGGGRGRR
jgi:hypothetical protein